MSPFVTAMAGAGWGVADEVTVEAILHDAGRTE